MRLPNTRVDVSPLRLLLAALVFMSACMHASTPVWSAERIVNLRSGLQLQGSVLELPSIDKNAFQAAGNNDAPKTIWMIDNGLTRIYVNQHAMVVPPANVAPADTEQPIVLDQRVPSSGGRLVSTLGTILGVSPFDKFGRRVFRMQAPQGPVAIHQGITELNSRFAKVEGLLATTSYIWDMRISTETFSSEQLNTILSSWIDQSTLDGRLTLYRFFIQSKRYSAARQTLQRAIKDFPEAEQLQRQLRSLTQQEAKRILDEALLRRKSGQPQFAESILQRFPAAEVAIETRIKVQDALDETRNQQQQAQAVLQQLTEQVSQLAPEVAASIEPLLVEMRRDMMPETFVRLNDYIRLGAVDNINLENRIALAVGGWLLGAGSGEQNLAVARSLIQVRDLVREYLANPSEARRDEILAQLQNQEGAGAENVAKIIRTMTPPMSLAPENADPEIAGLYRVSLPGRGEIAQHEYLIQLPPEYNPLRSYPCIVSLPQSDRPLDQQIAWFCGDYNAQFQQRLGPASRHGFIVIVPSWQNKPSATYEFTAREHYRVLSALRDALRRTSIDPDRVFLSGHGQGGMAAWDIALAHPDLWAGLITISSDAEKYIRHYSDNGKYFPQMFVMGELAGSPAPLVRNGAVIQRYLKPGYDTMLVTYRGRGEEDFHEQLDAMIQWMQLRSHRRARPPERIEAASMRSGDQFFWWLELGNLKPAVDINPMLWGHADRLRAGEISASVTANGGVQISSIPSDFCTIYLAPEMGIDMTSQIRIQWRTKSVHTSFDGRLKVMLEDVRTRGDRQQFYWMRVDLP